MEKFHVGAVLDVTMMPEDKDLFAQTLAPMLDKTSPENMYMAKNVTFH